MIPIAIEMILSQLFFWGIVVLSAMIAHEFWKSKNGVLRKLIIAYFISKVWAYGIAAVYYLMQDMGYFSGAQPIWIRLICNLPMFIVMLRLWKYIRTNW